MAGPRQPEQLDADLARAIIESAQALIVVADPEGRLLFFNRQCEEVLGYRREEVLGQVLWELFVPPEEMEAARAAWQQIGPDRPAYREDFWLTRDDERRLIRWQDSSLRDASGQVSRLVGIGIDITEHRAAEQAIHDSEQHLTHLTEVLTALREIDRLVTREKDRHTLLERTCEILTQTRGYYSACALLLDEQRYLIDSAGAGLDAEGPELIKRMVAGDLRLWIQEALKHQAPQVVADLLAITVLLPPGQKATEATALVAALRHGHRTFGVLCVTFPRFFVGDQEEVTLLAEVAADLALGLYVLEREEESERASLAVRDALEQYRVVIDNTNSWVAAFDLERRVRFWNPAAEEISGYSMIEVLNSDQIWEWLYPDPAYRELVLAVAARVMARGEQPRSLETSVRCRDGSNKVISWGIAPLRGGTGEISGLVAMGQEVTDRKRAEYALEEREQDLAAIFNSAADAIFIMDLEGHFLEVNQVACERLGYTREELLGMTPADVDTPENAVQVPARFRELLATGEVKFVTEHLPQGGGAPLPVEVFVRLVEYRGQPAALSTARDITRRRAGLRAVESERELARHCLEVVDNLVFTLDPPGKITRVNGLAAEKLGYREEELVGQDWFELLVPRPLRAAQRKWFADRLQEANGEVHSGELPVLNRARRRIVMNWRSKVIRDSSGEVLGMILAGSEPPAA
ncbi:MAG TPA: PAS domain S-box protein [Armatimonadota bacterium]|jgi:PAS domain S-box-containing protein